MNEYEIFTDDLFQDDSRLAKVPHLPLDWNKDFSLEEWLERIDEK